ncbi:MAG: (Fe-S)-binding protein [Sphingobacteriales bacterium]|nr:MAG: (Fe-S)-binding protein [Sphingobacteriales bacterium]
MHNVQLFIPCFVDQLYPETGMNMVKVLEKLGCNVTYNPKQTCCGQPAFNAGYQDDAKAVAQKFVNDFDGDGYIVGPSGSCTGFVRNYYNDMLENSSNRILSDKVRGKMYEFTEFLTEILKVEDIGAAFEGKATYHDACGALRECGIKQGPRKLLENVKGLELVEMKECETCCGFGGTFAVKYEPISLGMAQTKVKSAMDTGATYMISTDVSCMMHIQGYINKNGLPMQTIHIADILANGL